MTGEARSYAERLFDFPTIASLDPHAATTALVAPARAQGIGYEDDAIEFALEWTKGYPFYIQQIGKRAWNRAANSPITRADSRTHCRQRRRRSTGRSTRSESSV